MYTGSFLSWASPAHSLNLYTSLPVIWNTYTETTGLYIIPTDTHALLQSDSIYIIFAKKFFWKLILHLLWSKGGEYLRPNQWKGLTIIKIFLLCWEVIIWHVINALHHTIHISGYRSIKWKTFLKMKVCMYLTSSLSL